jgi:hypothetical protein
VARDVVFSSLHWVSVHKKPPPTGRSCAGSTLGAHEPSAARQKRKTILDFAASPFARAPSNGRKRTYCAAPGIDEPGIGGCGEIAFGRMGKRTRKTTRRYAMVSTPLT